MSSSDYAVAGLIFDRQSDGSVIVYHNNVEVLTIPATGGVDLSSVISGDVSFSAAGATTVTDLTISGETAADVLQYDGSGWESATVSGDVTIASGGAVTIADPYKIHTASVSLNNDGTGVDGAIVGTGAGSLGHASGVTVVPAVAGKVIDLVSAVLSFTYDTASYTGGGNVSLIYAGGVDATGTASAAASFGDSADNINLLQPVSGLALVNTAVAIVSASGFTDPGTAAGTATVTAHYRLVDA